MAFIYASVAYVEMKQLQRNINISYLRGTEKQGLNNKKIFSLEDGFSVFNDIVNTPKYWRKKRKEQ
jgi:hypothetical protein